jgi:predicted GIY-YIG superfamily endonuclease
MASEKNIVIPSESRSRRRSLSIEGDTRTAEAGLGMTKMKTVSKSFVYILLCADQTLYTGWTTDPPRRLIEHQAGKASKYTRCRLPVRMIYVETCENRSAALRREAAIKKLSKVQKQILVQQVEIVKITAYPLRERV